MKKEKIIIWLDRVMAFSLYAIIFTLTFSKSMLEIFFICALACWIVKRCIENGSQLSALSSQHTNFRKNLKEKILGLIKTFKPIKTKLNLPITAFVFIGFLSTVNSISLLLSLEGFFLKLFEWIMIYFIVVETLNNRRRLNRILLVMLLSMILMAINGIFQCITSVDFIRYYSIEGYQIQGSFKNPNTFGGWLVLMIPLVLSLVYFWENAWFNLSGKYNRFKKTMNPILWILTGLLIVCLVLTYSRGAWIAVAVSLIFLGIFKDKKLLVFTVVVLLTLFFIIPASIKNHAISIAKISNIKISRTILWWEALGIIEDFPLLGSGLNTYATVGPHYRITEEGGTYPHNSYLHMAAESGLLGLGAFIWIMVTLFRTSLTNLKRIQSRFYSAVLIGLLTGLFGFLIHSFTDTNIYTLQLGNLMWFIIGLIIATQRIALAERC